MSDNKANPQDLAKIRSRIDELDEQIQAAIAERAGLAQAVARAKGNPANSLEYYRPEREAEVLRRVVARNVDGPLSDEVLVGLYREIMSACLAQQEPLKIGYLGPEGTFTQSAVHKHFGQSVQALALGTIEDVFAEVESGVADFGVVPVENTTVGAVNNTLDMFTTSTLKICGEVELAIHQNLMSRATSLDKIERIYSHQQSLAQCRSWLHEHLPGVEKIRVSSNAEAARRVRYAEDAAAIAGSSAAHLYDLNVLAKDIEDLGDNTTRFLVLGRRILTPSGADKTSLLMSAHNKPGLLFQLLDPLAKAQLSLTRIESRPSKTGKWDYVFFVDVNGHCEEEPLKTALVELREQASLLKVLGSYPLAVH